MNWTLSSSKCGTTIQSADNNSYYLVFGNKSWSIQSGGKLLTNVSNLATIRGSATYTGMVKSTSTTMSFSSSVFAIKIGY